MKTTAPRVLQKDSGIIRLSDSVFRTTIVRGAFSIRKMLIFKKSNQLIQ